MTTKQWVAVHRKHHASCETVEDPHSPIVLGLNKVLFQGADIYRAAAKDKEMVERFSQGTPDDWIERNIYSKHSTMGILKILLPLNIILFGAPGLTMWAVQMAWIPFFAGRCYKWHWALFWVS